MVFQKHLMENLIIEFSLSKQKLLIVFPNISELCKQNILLSQSTANNLRESNLDLYQGCCTKCYVG